MDKTPKALAILNAMIIEYKKAKYGPDQPGLEYNSMKCNSANSLTQCIKKFLTLKGHQCERISTSGRVIDQSKLVTNVLGHQYRIGSSKYIPGTSTRGSADLSAIVKTTAGVVIPWKIEIKWGKDTWKKDQKEYAKEIIAAGGHYSIVRDLDDFLQQYQQLINQ